MRCRTRGTYFIFKLNLTHLGLCVMAVLEFSLHWYISFEWAIETPGLICVPFLQFWGDKICTNFQYGYIYCPHGAALVWEEEKRRNQGKWSRAGLSWMNLERKRASAKEEIGSYSNSNSCCGLGQVTWDLWASVSPFNYVLLEYPVAFRLWFER